MPGIVGLITRMPRKRAEQELISMVKSVSHETFYSTGMLVDESLGVYVGWAERKGSFSDGMPIWNERRDVGLVFSGEEFPDPGTAFRLKELGHVLDDSGPSYLVHLYEEDHSFPACLNGRFHGLIIDRTLRTVKLFNDRYGMHRIYYHESKDGFYFAAEAKAILKVRPELRSLDPKALGEFVSCGCVLEWRSLFQSVTVLPGGAVWDLQNGSVTRKGTYFTPREWEDQEPLEPESYYKKLRETYSQNLPRYFESQEQIGMSLTGGLDTRMIMAWLKSPSGALPCYTFGGMFRDCQDVIIARQVALVCQQPHVVIPVGKEFLTAFSHYAERTVFLTDGCADVSRSPDLYVNEKARGIAPIRMNGVYGGEVLRRVRAFKPVDPSPGVFSSEIAPSIREARETYHSLLEGHPLSFAVFKQAPWHHYGILALEQTQVSMRSPFLDNEFVKMVFSAPTSAVINNNVSLRLIADGNFALSRIPTDRGFGGAQGHILSVINRGILEFLFKAEYAVDYGMPQWLAKTDWLLSPIRVERLFLGRHKFYHFRVWYRDILARYVREMLLDSRTLSRGYVERRQLEAAVQGHLKGDRNYTSEIHKILTLELLHRLFLDHDPSKGNS